LALELAKASGELSSEDKELGVLGIRVASSIMLPGFLGIRVASSIMLPGVPSGGVASSAGSFEDTPEAPHYSGMIAGPPPAVCTPGTSMVPAGTPG
jgi:hypothetical protein